MALTPGTRLGVYEIVTQIGEGGMGQVYRATDTSLARQVAIKILPDAFAADPDRLARFEREARVLASLNHPNVAGIYAVEHSGGLRALVMELVEGDDLSRRIARGALPVHEALSIARQIADALATAHEEGIIHRDLKPANIKVRSDGTVKVLDFGLARAIEQGSGIKGQEGSGPTITAAAPFDFRSGRPEHGRGAMTETGVILGTPAYMAPEQACGKIVDRRADIFAFGAVLFEMLTGTRAFTGQGIAETLARVINDEPDWTRLPPTLSPVLRTYLQRCLNKDPKQRVGDAQDLRLVLEGAFEPAAPKAGVLSGTTGGWLPWVAAVACAMLAAALAVPAVRHLRERSPDAPPETRLDIVTPGTEQPEDFALSPDGRQLVFVAAGDGGSRLWVRSLAATTAQPLTGTEGASAPFWSPDGRAVAFFANSRLQRVDVNGGSPQIVAAITGDARGGAWNADGIILFAASGMGSLFRVSASGTDVTAVTKLDRQFSHRWPFFLPDGRHFLFAATGIPDTEGIYLGSLDRATVTRLTAGTADLNVSGGVYLPGGPGHAEASGEGGWLLWVRSGSLLAQRLDVNREVLTGEPVTLANPVVINAPIGRAALSASTSGVVAYRAGANGRKQLRSFDRSGKDLGSLGEPDGSLATRAVSPDGRRAAVYRNVQGNGDLWLLDGAHTSRFTSDPAIDGFPLWSADGERVAFRSRRKGTWDLYQKFSSGAGPEELLLESPQIKTPLGWSVGGRFLLYQSADPQTASDLWLLPMEGGRPNGQPSVFLKTAFAELYGRFSPDGHWVAYMSNESGRNEIYLRVFREPAALEPPAPAAAVADGQWPVSTAGGIHPRWRPDGRELYYLGPAGEMMGVSVTAKGSTLEMGTPVKLFSTHVAGGGVDGGRGPGYDVASDGRFLIITELDTVVAPITLLQHWTPDGRK